MITRPIIFVNTSNHAMAEIDTNYPLWKVEYRLWEEECPVYFGTNTRCEVEKYISKHALGSLFQECNDLSFFSCYEE